MPNTENHDRVREEKKAERPVLIIWVLLLSLFAGLILLQQTFG